MPEAITSALQVLIEASPYAGITVIVIFITNHYHFKQNKISQSIVDKAIKEIREAYSEVTDKLPHLYERVMELQDNRQKKGGK